MNGHEHSVQATRTYRVPLYLAPQPEGGYTVTSPLLPELITEGDTIEDALDHAREAFSLVVDHYLEAGKPLPVEQERGPIAIEQLVELAE